MGGAQEGKKPCGQTWPELSPSLELNLLVQIGVESSMLHELSILVDSPVSCASPIPRLSGCLFVLGVVFKKK